MQRQRTVAELCQESGLTPAELARKSDVEEQRILAIVMGRWTPAPTERDRVAAVFGLTRDDIVWGHVTPIQHIYGHGPA